MTEDEAKTKWCPFVRVMALDPRTGGNPPINREDYKNFNCIGSACMMWKCEYRITSTNKLGYLRRTQTEGGYCGLAGRSS